MLCVRLPRPCRNNHESGRAHPDTPESLLLRKHYLLCLMVLAGLFASQTCPQHKLLLFSLCTMSSQRRRTPCGIRDMQVRGLVTVAFVDISFTWSADLALQIIENLGVHEPDHPTLTPMPSPDFIHQSFKREAVRRIFWLIHLLDVMASIYFKKPTTFTSSDLRLRLPVDETSFELGVHSTLPGEHPSLSYFVISRAPLFWLYSLPLISFKFPPGASWELLTGPFAARRHHLLFL